MLVLWSWVREFLPSLKVSPEEAADKLTMVGLNVEEVSKVENDWVFDIEVTANRGDVMSHLGVARELMAIYGLDSLQMPIVIESMDAPIDKELVFIEDRFGCRRYKAIVVRDIPSDKNCSLIAERLEKLGFSSVNPLVDISNYVMLEVGQPLHFFDIRKLSNEKVIVRRAKDGEKTVSLDEVERELNSNDLVIADKEKVIAIAGIIGSASSEVDEETSSIFIESAWFDPILIRRTSKKLNLKTEASARFEKGTDPAIVSYAARRAVYLIKKFLGGNISRRVFVVGENVSPPKMIYIDINNLNQFAGVEIEKEKVKTILGSLGFEVETSGNLLTVVPPTYRRFDVEEKADLYEEILRFVGFDNLPYELPAFPGKDAGDPPVIKIRKRARTYFKSVGFYEAINYSFVDPTFNEKYISLIEGEEVELVNPLSNNNSRMRKSLLPGLLQNLSYNVRRGKLFGTIFEIGNVYSWKKSKNLFTEVELCAAVAGGKRGTPWDKIRDLDFYWFKGVIEKFFTDFGIELDFEESNVKGFRQAAFIRIEGEIVGVIGELEVADKRVHFPVWGAEFMLQKILEYAKQISVVLPSKFPAITFDYTVQHPKGVQWREIESVIERYKSKYLNTFFLYDRYEGKGVPSGMVNTTIRFVYQSKEGSLSKKDIEELHTLLIEKLDSWRKV